MLLTISLIWESVIWSVRFQNFICILYWTKSIRVVFKKVIEQLLSIFSICWFYSCSKSGIWIKLQCYEYFKAKSNRPRTSIGSIIPTYHPTYLPTYHHQLGTSSGSSGVISLADLQGQHETVRSWNTSLQLEHLFFSWPTTFHQRSDPGLRQLHTHQPLTSQSGGSK